MRPHRSTLPDPCDTHEQARRHRHDDLSSLCVRELRAELTILRLDIARRVYHGLRDRPYLDSDGVWRSETAWLDDRERRLRRELARRRGRR
jgi:hypothetical protein